MAADAGVGDNVVLVQTALLADEFVPLSGSLVRAGHHVVLYHRRGYGESSAVGAEGSVHQDAEDCRALLSRIGLNRPHVVSASYGAAVALELAASWPQEVQSLTLIEPPPVIAPAVAAEFLAANSTIMASYREDGPDVALESFLSELVGAGWRAMFEQWLPGSVEQVTRDAETFFQYDIPALTKWRFDDRDAARITCPVMYVGGAASGRWFAAARLQIRSWFPAAEDVLLHDADHNLVLTHSDQVATVVASFVGRQMSGECGPDHPRK
ncbi:alpha/beta fold hydrolase [Microbacterium esteraromaticum]|uniref:alpha/beta fold hydrolase n=1 Tax=Microbacterium esteraromaticum TaxID=57043 RepID=UPI001C956104|nr:alpha/beta hydrolase [Microbacterium esteraromaticum]MBY6061329.1 alpha/beta hydrolase [Microbacterium esteraromaticum]